MSNPRHRPTRPDAHRIADAAALAATALILGACGSSNAGTHQSSMGSGHMTHMSASPSGSGHRSSGGTMASMIMIKNFKFAAPASVKAGSTVEVMNLDSEAHSVTADQGNLFDVTVKPGKTATFTAPSKPGSYPFHCMFHSNMHGTLHVH